MDGNSIFEFFENSEEEKKAIELLRKVNETGESGIFEFTFKPYKNIIKPFPVEVSYRPLFVDGKIELIHLVMRNISARKEAANAIEQQNIELKERNAELDAFSHTVAHDLKTPLNCIVGFNELLTEELLEGNNEETLKYSKLINNSAFKMVHIIEELLLLASVRSQEVEKVSIEMEPIFNAACERINNLTIQAGATINPPDSWPVAFGYGPWIEEIWVNYLSNAIKYGGNPTVVNIYTTVEKDKAWFNICDF